MRDEHRVDRVKDAVVGFEVNDDEMRVVDLDASGSVSPAASSSAAHSPPTVFSRGFVQGTLDARYLRDSSVLQKSNTIIGRMFSAERKLIS